MIDWNEAKIVGRECNRFKRWIKEAIAIRKEGTTMNRDEGQYNLSHIFDDLLMEKSISYSTGNSTSVTRQQSTQAVSRASHL